MLPVFVSRRMGIGMLRLQPVCMRRSLMNALTMKKARGYGPKLVAPTGFENFHHGPSRSRPLPIRPSYEGFRRNRLPSVTARAQAIPCAPVQKWYTACMSARMRMAGNQGRGSASRRGSPLSARLGAVEFEPARARVYVATGAPIARPQFSCKQSAVRAR
jgi:hypothetical protein